MKSLSLETIKVKLIDQNNNSLYNTEFTHYDLDLYSKSLFLIPPRRLMKSLSLETIKVKLIDQNNNSLYNTEFTHYDLDLYNVAIFFLIWLIRIPMFL